MLFGFPPFYVDSDDIHLDEHKQLEGKIKAGFEPIVKEGFGAFFPAAIPVSEHCRYLLGKMLEMDVKKRWTVKECLSCHWIREFEDASSKTIPPIVRDALKKFHHTSKFKVAISNLFTHQIDEDHIEEMKKFFTELDENNDGAISLKEFKDGMMNKFNTELSDEQLEQIFSNVDIEDNRAITFNELLTITAHRMLVDEDERLYAAFTELDKDGDGLISKRELENAINDWEDVQNAKGKIRKSKHTRESTQMLKRFESAFLLVDQNKDGQIDYEEFLRILHPDFGDNDMSMADFKSSVTESNRVRGISYDVDYSTATPSEYVEVKPTPKSGPIKMDIFPLSEQSPVPMKTLTLDAFKLMKKQNSNKFEDDDAKELKDENQRLRLKLKEAEDERDRIRNKYESEFFEKMEDIMEQLTRKENQIHDKDILITNSNLMIEQKNQEIERLKKELESKILKNKNLEDMLENAIDSKMKSLVQSQAEIHKLKLMLSRSQGISLMDDLSNGYSSTSTITPHSRSYTATFPQSNSSNKNKKASHLSYLIDD